MQTLQATINRVLHRLDDEACLVWTRAQIENWIMDGYDSFARDTSCIFDMVMFSHDPLVANHTREFEEQFMGDLPIAGIFQFTREQERDFAGPSAIGPSNITRMAEASYVDVPQTNLLKKLPDGYNTVERVTHDWLRLDPEHSRYLRGTRLLYETQQGGVFAYSIEQDGFFSLRTVGVVPPRIPPFDIQGTWGLLRQEDPSESDNNDAVIGSWGILRASPLHFPALGPWGTVRQVIKDDTNTRVEITRLGRSLNQHPFEIPDYCVVATEYWAMYRAFSDHGPGENPELAKHFKERYEIEVQYVKSIVDDVMEERTIQMGGPREGQRDDYLQHFPSDYNYPRRFGP